MNGFPLKAILATASMAFGTHALADSDNTFQGAARAIYAQCNRDLPEIERRLKRLGIGPFQELRCATLKNASPRVFQPLLQAAGFEPAASTQRIIDGPRFSTLSFCETERLRMARALASEPSAIAADALVERVIDSACHPVAVPVPPGGDPARALETTLYQPSLVTIRY